MAANRTPWTSPTTHLLTGRPADRGDDDGHRAIGFDGFINEAPAPDIQSIERLVTEVKPIVDRLRACQGGHAGPRAERDHHDEIQSAGSRSDRHFDDRGHTPKEQHDRSGR
jgi:hypothetical protein